MVDTSADDPKRLQFGHDFCGSDAETDRELALFQYIFQWRVSVGLVIALSFLSGAALLFQYFHSPLNTVGHGPGRFPAIVSVWKSALSVSMKRLPTVCSERLLIAPALLLGLIFLNLTSAQLFVLVKSKPRHSSIKTLQELHGSNLSIYAIHKQFAPYLNVFENTSLRNLKVNLRTDKMYEKIYYFNPNFFNITDRALVYTNTIVDLIKSLPRSRAFLQYFEVMKEPIFQTLLQLFLLVGSLDFKHINAISVRLSSAGVFPKWYDANRYLVAQRFTAFTASNASQTTRQTDDDDLPLTYDDLKMAFYVLYAGLTVSTLCFLKEVCKF